MPLDSQAKTSGAVLVGTGSTTILSANVSRRELTIVNTSANIIDLAFNVSDGSTVPTAVALAAGGASGVRLAAGATYSTRQYKGPIAGIAQTAPSLVSVLEL